VSRYQKGKTNLDFTEARDGEWKWHQLGHTQIRTSLQTDNHASTPTLSFLQAGCPSCCPTNSVKALKEPALKEVQGTREIGVRTEKKNANGTKQSRCTDPRVLRPQSHDPRSAARLDELRQSLREFAALVVGEAGS